MSKLHPYQFKQAESVTGLVTENHLGIMFQNKPQLLKKSVTRLLSSAGVRNVDTLLNMYPVKKMEEEGIYTWDITGDSEKNVPLVEARLVDGSEIPASGVVGEYGNEFLLVFAEAYFADVHMIVGERNELYQLRIKEDAYEEGSNFVYLVELMGRNQNGMTVDELQPGKRFSKDFSPVEDIMSTKGGEISFTSPSKVGNEFTTIRLQHTEPGKNIGKKVVTPIILKKGEQEIETTSWMPAVEWEIEKTWSYEKAHAIMFSRSNKTDDGRYFNIGKSGYYIKQGMGLREQQEVSNTVFYDKFSLPQLESIISDIGGGRLDFSERTILVRTGEMGMAQASRAMSADVSGWNNLGAQNPATFKQTQSDYHSNAFIAGFQFTEWLAPMGYHVKFEVDPMYDSKVRNKIRAPHLGGGVAESYRYNIYFIGKQDDHNIYKVELERGDDWGYESGFRNPITGDRQIMNMSHSEDSATYTRYGSFSGAIVDPGRVVTMIPNILQYTIKHKLWQNQAIKRYITEM